MTAGAFGGETWAQVIDVQTMDRRGREHTRQVNEYEVEIPECRGAGRTTEWFVASATLKFAERKPLRINESRVRELLREAEGRSRVSRGMEETVARCSRIPPGDHAARLIEAAGFKGYRIGDASVSGRSMRELHHQRHGGDPQPTWND